MVSKKGKKKLIYGGRIFYWFVRADQEGMPRLYILSEDKKIRIERALMEREGPVVSEFVGQLLERHLENDKTFA